MKSTVITIDIKTNGFLKNEYTGSIFRGWLGFILKCNSMKSCDTCTETEVCPYYMVFKEKTEIKPYSILSFKNGHYIRNFIKIHGDRKKFVPKILSEIIDKANTLHFGGQKYSIELLEAKNIEIPDLKLSENTCIVFVSPLHILRDRKIEVIPSFSTLLAASIRSYNRITKYYDSESYPYKISDEISKLDFPIQDFDIRTVNFIHKTKFDKSIILNGSIGWVKYDTSSAPHEAGGILKMGEALQIGKHTTYGLGGFFINKEV